MDGERRAAYEMGHSARTGRRHYGRSGAVLRGTSRVARRNQAWPPRSRLAGHHEGEFLRSYLFVPVSAHVWLQAGEATAKGEAGCIVESHSNASAAAVDQRNVMIRVLFVCILCCSRSCR